MEDPEGDGNPSMAIVAKIHRKSDRLDATHCAVERWDKFSVKI